MLSPSLPTSMQAAVLTQAGQPLVLTETPLAPLAPDRVLVRVCAAGLNPLDTKIRAGTAAHAQHPLPAVLGIDMAGVVVAIGSDVSDFVEGDRVFGMTGGVGGVQGALAEYTAVDPALLARIPPSLSLREAAATPLVFITAWEGLIDRARVQAGDHVLIHGGAGGVGHVAIQIAKARGAKVFATGEPAQAAIIRSYGATFIDYRSQSVDAYVAEHTAGEGFDIVLDTVGGATLDVSFTAIRPYSGRVVSILGWGAHSLAPLSFRAGTYSGVFTLSPLITGQGRDHHGFIMQQAARMFAAGWLSIRTDSRRFRFEEAEAAYQYLESGDANGKVLVELE